MLRNLGNQDPKRLHVGRSRMFYGLVCAAFGGGGERVWYRDGVAISEKEVGLVGEVVEFHDRDGDPAWLCFQVISEAKVAGEGSPSAATRQVAEAKHLYGAHWRTARILAREAERRGAQEKVREEIALLALAPAGTYHAQSITTSFGGWILFPVGGGHALTFDRGEVGGEIVREAEELMKRLGLI